MEYLVTGGAGFIGSNIVRHLVETGRRVRVLDDLSTGRKKNLDGILDDVELVEGSILDAGLVNKAVKGAKYVFHLAALPSVPRSVKDPVTSSEINVMGTVKVLTAARDAGVERFVFSSSSSVYGDTPTLPKREDMVPMPLSPYAVQKLAGEYYCRIFCKLYGLKTFALRYFNVFGPRQDPKSQYAAVIPSFINALKNGEAPRIHGDGGQTRDFTYVGDVVSANMCCCDAPDEAAGEVYNVAHGDRVSVNSLVDALLKIMKKDIKPMHEESRAGDVRDSQADASKAMEHLGWVPGTDFSKGLRSTVDWFINNNE